MVEIKTYTPPEAKGWEIAHVYAVGEGEPLNAVEITVGGQTVEMGAVEVTALIGAAAKALAGVVDVHPQAV